MIRNNETVVNILLLKRDVCRTKITRLARGDDLIQRISFEWQYWISEALLCFGMIDLSVEASFLLKQKRDMTLFCEFA